jgi:L-ascorbate metabolism protein UlaG (beta-lactamase superfamily)
MSGMRLRFHGHACFSLRLGGAWWLLDPFDTPLFDDRFTYPRPSGRFDYLISSHDHLDHDGRSWRGHGQRVDAAGLVGETRVELVPTSHDEAAGAYLGGNQMIALRAGRLSLLHAGDLGQIPSSDALASVRGVTALLVPVGGTYTLDAAGAWRLIDALAPRVVIPMHYRTPHCGLPMEGPTRFLAMARERGTHPVRFMADGQLDVADDTAPGVYWLARYEQAKGS